jgi:hypothetical protein
MQSRRFRLPRALRFGLCLFTALLFPAAFAQVDELLAFGKPAVDVTGNILVSDGHIKFQNGQLTALDLIGNSFTVGKRQVHASVYRVTANENPALENGSRLCTSGPVTHVIFWKAGPKESAMAVFTGKERPAKIDEACTVYAFKDGGPVSVPTSGN